MELGSFTSQDSKVLGGSKPPDSLHEVPSSAATATAAGATISSSSSSSRNPHYYSEACPAPEHRREKRLQEHTVVWKKSLLPYMTPGAPPTSRMQRYWRQGLPPAIRESVWPVAIGNVLRITPELFEIHKEQALEARRAAADAHANVMVTLSDQHQRAKVSEKRHEKSTALIPFDLPRTFPTLAFFREGGPLHDDCMRILEAYTFFRPDIGYVQGMTYLAAVLLLYVPPYQAFVALCNLLNAPTLLGLYRLEQSAVQGRSDVFTRLCKVQFPEVARVIDDVGLMPEMYLIEWFMTIYAKVLPIDVASVVWDLFLLDGEVILYFTALGIISIVKDRLLQAPPGDLELCSQILGKDLRARISDPDELLLHIREVRRRTPARFVQEIQTIAESEFGTGGSAQHSPGGRSPGGTLAQAWNSVRDTFRWAW
mmetsp:Transcript_37366/g.81200  ORF Transcript_37366/g.81200 Transcript_37366/m.81200 type:complete len:426 (-) Transcript_37366:118-1395(-)